MCEDDEQDVSIGLQESYLGLEMPTQSDYPPEYLCRLTDLIEEHIDLSALLQVPLLVTMTVPVSCVCN